MNAIADNGFTQAQVISRLQGADFEYRFQFDHLDKSQTRLRAIGTAKAETWSVSDRLDADTHLTARGQVEKSKDYTIDYYNDLIQIWVLVSAGAPGADLTGYLKYSAGVFRIGEVSEETDAVGVTTLTLALFDLTSLLEYKPLVRIAYLKDDLYTEKIDALLSDAGITARRVVASDKKLPANVDWEKNTARWEIFKSLCGGCNYWWWTDENGRVIVEPKPDPRTAFAAFDFVDDARSIIYTAAKRATRSLNTPNYVELMASIPGQDGPPLIGKASNTNLSDPASIPARGLTIPFYADVEAPDQETIDRLAAAKLLELRGRDLPGELASQIMPFMRAGDVVTITHAKAGFSDKHQITALEYTCAASDSNEPIEHYNVAPVGAMN